MDIDIPFKINFITIKTKNFKEKKRLIKKELKKYPEKRFENFYSNRDNNKIGDKDRSIIYEPKAEEGDIVIIPQHIVHFTRPNPVSFKKRIISFDFKL